MLKLNFLLQAAAASMSEAAPAVDEALREEQEDFEDLAAVLQHLGLSEYRSTFDQEKIDVESFVS